MTTVGSEPLTQDLKLVNNSSNPKKGRRLGVMSITKAENAQLGLILKHLSYQKRYLKLPKDVIRYPDAFEKLCSRYST